MSQQTGNKSCNPHRMKKTLLFVLTVSALSALSSHVIREYHSVDSLRTWAEAQSYCRDEFTDLATVENEGDNNRLLSGLQDTGSDEPVWIGLHDHLDRWKWSLGDTDLNNDFSNWKTDEPDNNYHEETCVTVSTSGFWLDNSCFRLRHPVCCDERGDFHLVETKMTWHEAQTHCRTRHKDLATVKNKAQNDEITMRLSALSWIGLHRKTWGKWSDQTPASFTNWKPDHPVSKDQPTKSCVMVNAVTGLWWDEPCDRKHHFICQTAYPPARQRKTFQLKFQSEANLKDPAVQQQLLEQLHAKLEKHGLSDFKLRWTQRDGQTFHKQKKKEEGSDC